MSYASSATQTIMDQAEANRHALRELHQGLEAHRAQLKYLFSVPPPGTVRHYIMPAELTFDGDLTKTTAHVVVGSEGLPPDQVPANVRIEYVWLDRVIFKANASGVDLDRGIDLDLGSDSPLERGKSILHSVVRFRDLPDLEFTLPSLLHWLRVRPTDFAHSEMQEEIMMFAHLEHFLNWVNACLDILYDHGLECSDSSQGEGEGAFRLTPIAEANETDEASSLTHVTLGHFAPSSLTDVPRNPPSKSSSFLSFESGVCFGRWPQSLENDILAQLSVSGIILDHSPRESRQLESSHGLLARR